MLERVFPFFAAPKAKLKPSAPQDPTSLVKRVKPKTLAMGYRGTYIPYRHVGGQWEESPYDFESLIEAIDTDSYVKQAFLKYQDLFWKEGWQIVGENPEAVQYLHQRIDLFEEAMQRSFDDFLEDVADQWCKFSNAFVVKSRGPLSDYYTNMGPDTVIGYYMIPTETVEIVRDKHNRITAYRQGTYDGYVGEANPPTFRSDDVIHLYQERKPGYAFGMPALMSALDDVHSLRLMEQDDINLFHQQLFPIYQLKVGSDEKPASQDELEEAGAAMDGMREDGSIITSDRHEISVIGSEGKALDVTPHLGHFKERVAIGLGVFPHHLGMATQGTNRSATDRLDTALYDRVKRLQKKFEGFVRLNIFNELLREGGFDPITTPSAAGPSDRCYMKFREIDIDTQIKQENHAVFKHVSNVTDLLEAREELGMSGEPDPELMYTTIQAKIQTAQQVAIIAATPQPPKAVGPGASAPPAPKKPDAQKSSAGVVPNLPNARKDSGNKNAPTNQFTRRLSPNVRHSDDASINISEEWVDQLVELIADPEEENGDR